MTKATIEQALWQRRCLKDQIRSHWNHRHTGNCSWLIREHCKDYRNAVIVLAAHESNEATSSTQKLLDE